jgi:hypothetical protein
LKVTGGFQTSWNLLVWAASFPSDAKDSQVFADIPNAVAFDIFGADPIAARPAYESTLEWTCAQDAARRP